MTKIYNLFISHSWTYSNQYDNLINLLNNASYFEHKNYSVPKDNPIHRANSDKALKEAIKCQMKSASVIIILAGVYSTYSRWINIEIELAKYGFIEPKKIIAIEPWGSQHTSTPVKKAADVCVGWNTTSIINAIKKLG